MNKLAEGQKFMALGDFDYSDDNTLLAYTTDVNGHRDYDFHLKNLADGRGNQDAHRQGQRLTWAADNKTIFYVTEDDAKRSDKVCTATRSAKSTDAASTRKRTNSST